MADRLRQALRFLSSAGPLAFARGVRQRMSASVDLALGTAPQWGEDLATVATRLTLGGTLPGDLVWAMQKRSEVLRFLELAQDPAPRAVLEIGTAAGGLLHLLARIAAPDAVIVSVDLPGGRFGGGYGVWRRPLYRRLARTSQRLVLIRGDSHSELVRLAVCDALRGRSLDVLFIDGDHSLAGVEADFVSYAPLVREGGIVAIHDIVENRSAPDIQVPAFWAEIKRVHEVREIVDVTGPPGYGIGVLRWAGRSVEGAAFQWDGGGSE